MKSLSIIILLTLFVGCDPYGFGYKNNPAFVLNEGYEAVKAIDVKRFLSVTGKEALCVYGNTNGLSFLKKYIVLAAQGIKLDPKVLDTTYFNTPQFVGGYWSYYHERYGIDVLDKVSHEVLMESVVDCDYGVDGTRNAKWVNQKPIKYPKKECRVIKIIPRKFDALSLPAKCEGLRVDL